MGEYYKIGELSSLSSLSRRTLDYYTKLGLIRPKKRTHGNFRLYGAETLERLKRIEVLKEDKYTLDEIKQTLNEWDKINADQQVAEKLSQLQLHLKQLEREVKEISPYIEQLKPKQAKNAFKRLTPQTAACIEALLVLLGKGPLV